MAIKKSIEFYPSFLLIGGKHALYLNNNRTVYNLIIISLIIIFIPSQAFAQNWVYITSSSDTMFYYNKDSIRINKKDHIIKVWLKYKYLKDYKDNKRNNNLYLSSENWNKLNYSYVLTIFNYNAETYLFANMTDYSYSGEVLHSTESVSDWSHILPGSICEDIFENVIEASGIKR